MSSEKPSTFTDVYKALSGSKTGPLNQGPRSDLDTHLRKYESPKLFTALLDYTNKGLGINTTVPLPKDKAEMYIKDAKRVEKGKISSTRAFARSARDWYGRGDMPGTVMNVFGTAFAGAVEGGGAFLSAMNKGMEEDRRRKTGRW